ncbi:sugar ABC transporter ATP-binding protein [Pleomorphomonas sp. NRK KF1]|uniref:sugar ABC transporter ATP-binding protein n=1 Tax=Pleomorphomonas sp. NRK KF1 TaxID=2943000 RepID=UPI00204462B6|nr:sugar ABC transporter ATP-binding protein [Pleomorphomonas sp. NRK KF1]MCM5553152.1 sugar ABC transporter ATP-binding protein [Pleomorphomonas sp. NRK KF1]
MPSAPETTPILEMRGISKTFPGVKALANVELTVYPGEVHALMGENGAGKSTLMKILSGAYRADPGGELRINGEVIHIDGPLSAKTKGIAVIYQELSLSPNLTVAENIYLGRELSSGGQVDRTRMRADCQGVLDRLGATFGPATIVSTLSIAERQMVEIARAIHANARILVMDEPTTALSSRETDKLFDLIRTLRADGLAIIYISHRMAEVYELADRCSVLRDGSYVGTLTRDELSAEKLVKMMVGRDLSKFYKKDHDAKGSRGEIILSVSDMSDGHRVRGCSFDLHQGEVLCLAGLVGSGRTELARLIYGADSRKSGTVALDGKPIDIARPIQAVDAGIVYLTEDRKGQGLFLDMTVQENINLQVIGRDAAKGGLLDLKKARVRALDAIKALSIRVAGPIVEVGSLSGGNQQKVLLSRLLETRPRVLILDEPTRGVDIGAKSEIYRIIDDLVQAGVGVLVISSEMPEVVGIADRVLVMREGHIVGEVGGTAGVEITQENIIALAAGLAHPSAPAA